MADSLGGLAVWEDCLRSVNLILSACSVWKSAGIEMKERVVRLESLWIKIETPIDIVQKIATTNSDDYRRMLNQQLKILASKLSLALSRIQGIARNDPTAKTTILGFLSWARKSEIERHKDALDLLLDDLDKWQKINDPSWYLILSMSRQEVDEQPEKAHGNVRADPLDLTINMRQFLAGQTRWDGSVFLPYQQLDIVEIPLSIAKAGRRRDCTDTGWLIIDSIICSPYTDINQTTKNVRRLVRGLSQANPMTFGLLACKGAMKRLDLASQNIISFELMFEIPENMEVLQSLRRVLMDADIDISLNRRVRIAKELAKSVHYVHVLGFVHQNIRPESVLLFEDTIDSHSSTFLVGFDSFREDGGREYLIGDEVWEHNVYRHPSRQGSHPEEFYAMHHDIYSLGVCLLEIGLWQSFVAYSEESSLQAKYGAPYSQFFVWLREFDHVPSGNLLDSVSPLDFMGSQLKEYLIDLARTKLPAKIGERYAKVVLSCLTCLDENNTDFGEVFDEDGITAGVRYIEHVLLQLDEISL